LGNLLHGLVNKISKKMILPNSIKKNAIFFSNGFFISYLTDTASFGIPLGIGRKPA
jgi:hypothetical protein